MKFKPLAMAAASLVIIAATASAAPAANSTAKPRYGSFGLAKIGGSEGAIQRMRGDAALGSFGAIEALARAIEGALGATR